MKEIYGKLREEHVQLLRTVSSIPVVDLLFIDFLANSLQDDLYSLLDLH